MKMELPAEPGISVSILQNTCWSAARKSSCLITCRLMTRIPKTKIVVCDRYDQEDFIEHASAQGGI